MQDIKLELNNFIDKENVSISSWHENKNQDK